jgi:hypothetical protein
MGHFWPVAGGGHRSTARIEPIFCWLLGPSQRRPQQRRSGSKPAAGAELAAGRSHSNLTERSQSPLRRRVKPHPAQYPGMLADSLNPRADRSAQGRDQSPMSTRAVSRSRYSIHSAISKGAVFGSLRLFSGYRWTEVNQTSSTRYQCSQCSRPVLRPASPRRCRRKWRHSYSGHVALIRQGRVGSGEARDTGLGPKAEAGREGRGEGSEFFERIDCSISCSFVISRVSCSRSAVNWSMLRIICSTLCIICS